MRIKLNVKSDIDLIYLEAGLKEKMRIVILKSLNACVSMEKYFIPYDLSNVNNDIVKRARIYSITFSSDKHADIIKMLNNTLVPDKLIKFLLRCYSFGNGYPDYKLLNLIYMSSDYFKEENSLDLKTFEPIPFSTSELQLSSDTSDSGLMNLTRMEMK